MRQCDVTDREDTAAPVAETVDRFGGLDVLVNSAGIATRATLTDLEPVEWNEVIDVNLTGSFNCSQAAVPESIDGGGAIVNISSMAGRNISYHARQTTPPRSGASSGSRSTWRGTSQITTSA